MDGQKEMDWELTVECYIHTGTVTGMLAGHPNQAVRSQKQKV